MNYYVINYYFINELFTLSCVENLHLRTILRESNIGYVNLGLFVF